MTTTLIRDCLVMSGDDGAIRREASEILIRDDRTTAVEPSGTVVEAGIDHEAGGLEGADPAGDAA